MSNKPIIVKFTGPNPSIEVITIGHFTDNLVNDVTFEFNRYIGDIDLAQFYCMLHIENLGATLLQTKVSGSKLQAVLTVTTDITNFPGAHTSSIKFVRDTDNLQYVWTTRNFDLIVESRIDLDKEIQHIDPVPLAGFIIKLAANTERINDLEESKLNKPQEIQAGTFPKVTINQYGLVTEGHDLSSEDIPPIPISHVSGLAGELEAVEDRIETLAGEIDSKLADKADLVDGKVPLEQLPDMEITKQKVEDVLTGDITSHNHSTEIDNHNTSETAHNDIRQKVDEAKAIAEGKSRARVFATESALNTWLSNPENAALLQIGDNLYIEELDKPDYWWNGTNKVKLETEKVDLTDYAKTTDIINFSGQDKVHLQENGTPLLSTFSYGLNANNVTPEGKNIFVGNAGNTHMGSTAISPTHSSYNTALGYNALYSNTTGYQNTAIGLSALHSNTTGNTNTAVGYYALRSNTTGARNTALGHDAGLYIANGTTAKITGNDSVFIGYNSKASANGESNEIVIGYNAVGKGANTVALGNSSVTNAYVGEKRVLVETDNIPLSKIVTGSTHTDILIGAPDGGIGTLSQSTFALASHNHDDRYYTETEVDTKLGGKADTAHTHTKSEITDFPTSMTPTAHNHTKSEITDFPTSMPPTEHAHDDRYYTETEVDTKLGGKADTAHTHTKSEITDFPTSMTPTAHQHTKSEITDFPTIPTIPDITVNNGSAESGKYISQVAVDATDKHKLIVTKENLPTGFSGDFGDLTNVPEEFPPTEHNHDSDYYKKSETYSKTEIDAMFDNLLGGEY